MPPSAQAHSKAPPDPADHCASCPVPCSNSNTELLDVEALDDKMLLEPAAQAVQCTVCHGATQQLTSIRNVAQQRSLLSLQSSP